MASYRLDVISLAPQAFAPLLEVGVIGRAFGAEIAELYLHNPRDYAIDRYRKVDDLPYGGGAGMVLMMEPIDKCLTKLMKERQYDEIIYMTPDAKTLDQGLANKLSSLENLVILTGHYKGVDQRIRDKFVTLEISIGDYVLSGGELAAAVLCDAVIRLIPGVLGDETSALTDSFQDNLLAPPVYTRPADYEGMKVPEVLLSGNFPKIEEWRHEEALKRTKLIRPDLLNKDSNEGQ